MYQQFKDRAEAVSAEVHRFSTRPEALEFILAFLAAGGVADSPGSYAVWADGTFLEPFDKPALSRRATGLRFDVSRQSAADARIGISQVDWAVADTGTLLVDATAVEHRLVSTLPVIHIALAATTRLLPDLASGLQQFDPARCAYLSAITGPSRTADIERVLTIGVHGPRRLIIVFVDDLEKAGRP